MRKRLIYLLAIWIICISTFAGCSGKSYERDASTSNAADMKQGAGNADTGNNGAAKTEIAQSTVGNGANQTKSTEDPKIDSSGTALMETGITTKSVDNAILAQRKVIRNANVTVEVEDFDVAYAAVSSSINGFGYIQESSIKTDRVYVDNKEKLIRNGIIILRIDKEKFDSVLTDVKGLGLVLDWNIDSDDVTDKFFDTESRVRLLKYEESRLEEYLKKQSDPDIIFKTESQLTEIRHEIESLTGTLQKWNDLVQLSTITLNMREKTPIPAVVPPIKQKSYLEKLSGSFIDSVKGVVKFCGDLLILIVQILPMLVLIGIILLISIVVYRRFLKNLMKKSNHKEM